MYTTGTFTLVPNRRYRVEVERMWHDPYRSEFQLNEGEEKKQIPINLQRSVARMAIGNLVEGVGTNTAQVRHVWLSSNGKPIPEAQRDLVVGTNVVSAGTNEFVAELDGWPAQTNLMVLQPNDSRRISFDFKRGTLLIGTEPAGATASAATGERTQTPGALKLRPGQIYTIIIEKSGYETLSLTNIQVTAGITNRLPTIPLREATGELIVSADPPGIQLFREGIADPIATISNANTRVPLSVGEQTLIARFSGLDPVTRKVIIKKGEPASLNLSLAYVSIEVRSSPAGAMVSLIQQDSTNRLDRTPYRMDFQKPGPYRFALSLSNYEEEIIQTNLQASTQLKVLNAQLSLGMGTLVFTSDPDGALIETNGVALRRTPFTNRVPASEFTVTARHPDYPFLTPKSRSIRVAFGERRTERFPFDYGQAVLDSDPPGASVFQGTNNLGPTPFTDKVVELDRKQQYRLERQGYFPKEVELVATKANPAPQQVVKLERIVGITNQGIQLALVWVPAMPDVPDGRCLVGMYEVTQKQFESIMGTNSSPQKGDNLPVYNVAYTNALDFCEKLTVRDREFLGSKNLGAYRYTLPTTRQWAYMAGERDWKSAVIQHVLTGLKLDTTRPQPVGTLQPNKLGLHDVRGNVWEWCVAGPTGALMGASFQTFGDPSRPSIGYKFDDSPGRTDGRDPQTAGFRVLLVPPGVPSPTAQK